jgi:hypothetical protein
MWQAISEPHEGIGSGVVLPGCEWMITQAGEGDDTRGVLDTGKFFKFRWYLLDVVFIWLNIVQNG